MEDKLLYDSQLLMHDEHVQNREIFSVFQDDLNQIFKEFIIFGSVSD